MPVGCLEPIASDASFAEFASNPTFSTNCSLILSLVEEAVRWTIPLQNFMRTAATDVEVEVRNRQMVKGYWVMLCSVSGNRDEEAFEDPDCFSR
jgi:cytochrome P450